MKNALALLAGTLALAACHDSGGDAASFDATVTNLIQNGTSETAAPIEIAGRVFVFPADEAAFDDLLPPDAGAVVPQ
jgi:hypothetical protein